MLARRIEPPDRNADDEGTSATRRAAGRWRRPEPQPSRGPKGPVRWWERPAPRGDELLWEAVQRLQARRLACRYPLRTLAERLAHAGHPIRRETLSRILNGKQRTSWPTALALAEVLGVDLADLLERQFSRDEGDDDGTVVPLGR